MQLRPRQQIGTLARAPETFGHSVLGAPLDVWLPSGGCKVLVFAAIHGEEAESTVALSRALRQLGGPSPQCATVLALNPDGLSRGTRGNANGVDLNRNFPTSNWQAEPVCHRATLDQPRDVELSPGVQPGSEPETQALLELIRRLKPETVVAIHAPLACIEDPEGGELAKWLAEKTELPLVDDVGYPTPGSFGTWCTENSIGVITYEIEDASIETAIQRHTPVLLELLMRDDL